MKAFSIGRYFAEINTLTNLQFMPGEKPYIDRPSAVPEPKDLLLYLGCNVLRTAHLARTAVSVLKAMGYDFNAIGGPAFCCGIVHHGNHDLKGARALAANNMRRFERFGATKVLMWCPSCIEHYDEVVTKEQEVAFPYEHLTAFIARHLDRITFVHRVERRVAMHYHGGCAQSNLDWQHTRTILRAIPGIALIDLDHGAAPGRHCNPKWIAQVGRPQWQKSIAGMLAAAKDASVDLVATVYHSCHREICQEESNYPFAIVNYISLLGEAMGIEYPDLYKRYKLRGDPDAIFDAVQPYILVRRLDSTRVRETLRDVFAPGCQTESSNPS